MIMPKYPTCFVCGEENERGLKLTFTETENGIEAPFNLPDNLCSYKGVIHGGIVSTILDEGLGWAGYPPTQKHYLTAELKVRYKRPVMSNTEYITRSRLVDLKKKIFLAAGEIVDRDGNILVTAEAKYFIVKEPQLDRETGTITKASMREK